MLPLPNLLLPVRTHTHTRTSNPPKKSTGDLWPPILTKSDRLTSQPASVVVPRTSQEGEDDDDDDSQITIRQSGHQK